MLGENIKSFRKRNGYSQETLAQQLNVVRQTVSKWEKGISVPDADMLTKIAELFDVTVEELLGAEPKENREAANMNEIATQLAILNEQLANQSRRRRTIIRRAAFGIFAVIALVVFIYIASLIAFMYIPSSGETKTSELLCTLDGEEYIYSITYDEQYRIISAGGDAFVDDHVQTEQYYDANILMAQIEDYFTDRGGTCQRTDQTGNTGQQ
ncbi:helix-turn-helix domain-containing protein [bacterium 210820-DFI.6.37]|nr:helix-turn-helix domain-containing protein [bacterium 210820-DFI.6.37]